MTTSDDTRALAAHVLTPRQHAIWRLRIAGMPWPRIAQILGVSERTARTHWHRANRRIQKEHRAWADAASAPTNNAQTSTPSTQNSSAEHSKKPTP